MSSHCSKPPGVIVNPQSGGVRRDPDLVTRLEALLPDGHVQVTPGADAVPAALRQLRARDVEALVIVGGDGSVRGTLTGLIRSWPDDEALPALVPTRGGTVNTIAQALGARGRPERSVTRLLEGMNGDLEPEIAESVRPALEVRADGGPAEVGMIYGNGVTVRWLELYYGQRRQGVVGASTAIARAAASAAVGGPLARRLFEPFEARVDVDDSRVHEGELTISGAAGIADVGLGFRPFWSAAREPDAFHFLWTDASAARLCAELPALRLNLHGPLSCLRHHPAHRVTIEAPHPQPWSLDADLFPAAARLELRPSRPLTFWAL